MNIWALSLRFLDDLSYRNIYSCIRKKKKLFWSVAFSKTSPFSFEEISNKNNIKLQRIIVFLWGYEQNNFVHLPVEQNTFVLGKITKTSQLAIFLFVLKHLLHIILDICVLLSENTVVHKNENFITKKKSAITQKSQDSISLYTQALFTTQILEF